MDTRREQFTDKLLKESRVCTIEGNCKVQYKYNTLYLSVSCYNSPDKLKNVGYFKTILDWYQ